MENRIRGFAFMGACAEPCSASPDRTYTSYPHFTLRRCREKAVSSQSLRSASIRRLIS
jgi:hypothetical protein